MVIMHPMDILRTITKTAVVIIRITIITNKIIKTSKSLIMASTNKMAMARCSKIPFSHTMVITYNKIPSL